MASKPQAYRGDLPYTFVCYSHEDTELVFPEISTLCEADIKVWYDEGISAGSEWTQEIADAIDDCAYFLFFITPAAVSSRHCRNEVQYALDNGKAMFYVYLAPTTLPGGLQLSIGLSQALHKASLSPGEYQTRLLTALSVSPIDEPAPQNRKTETRNREAVNHYLKGRAMLKHVDDNGTYEHALQQFDSAIRIDSDYAEAHASRCETFLKRYRINHNEQDFVLAESAAHRATRSQGSNTHSWEVSHALGSLHLAAGEYALAQRVLTEAHQAYPQSITILTNLASATAQTGNPTQAEQLFRRAIEMDPADLDARHALGSFLYLNKKYQEAYDIHKEILELAPDNVPALIGTGSELYMLGRYEESSRQWQLAERKITPARRGTMALLYSNRGLSHYYDGDFEHAITCHRKAVEFAPEDHRLVGRVAECCRALGESDAEKEYYRQAITLAEQELVRNPNDWETLGLLGLYHGFTGDTEQALASNQKMLLLEPKNPTAQYFHALIRYSIGEPDGALDALQHALQLGFSKRTIARDPDLKQLRQSHLEQYIRLIETGA